MPAHGEWCAAEFVLGLSRLRCRPKGGEQRLTIDREAAGRRYPQMAGTVDRRSACRTSDGVAPRQSHDRRSKCSTRGAKLASIRARAWGPKAVDADRFDCVARLDSVTDGFASSNLEDRLSVKGRQRVQTAVP